jgi:crotonobetainyl-CoA:carnitine CoA-transferase CaiB-like acyl-CoA transferase
MMGALSGVRVLDFTERMQGPYGTQILGDLGADVIKVERPGALTADGRADDRYGVNELYGKTPEASSIYPAAFLASNRNKRSLALDLKSADGVETARRLIAFCDVVYENFRPDVMDRLGLGYEDCAKINPSIVYASASGYGTDGPYARFPGQDVLTQAIGGFGAMNASAAGRPTPVGMSITDLLGGMNGAIAVLAALVHRRATGEGQHVKVDLLSSAIAAQSEQAVHFLNGHPGEPVRGTVMHANPYVPPPYGFYATKDGYIALSSGRQIVQLSHILGIPDLTQDPRFDTFAHRDRNRAEMEDIIEAALSQRTTAEWMPIMRDNDMYAAPVHNFEAAFSDPQVAHRNLIATIDSPIGPLKLTAPPYTFTKTPASIRTAPPRHGQHTAEILAELDHFERSKPTARKEIAP